MGKVVGLRGVTRASRMGPLQGMVNGFRTIAVNRPSTHGGMRAIPDPGRVPAKAVVNARS
jgi:hypothetical protein